MIRKAAKERGQVFDTDLLPSADTEKLLRVAHEQHGLTDRDIARLTGFPEETICRIRNGNVKSGKIRRSTITRISQALENADIAERHPQALVDAAWMRQMSLSLCAQGFTLAHQREILQNNLGIKGSFIKGAKQSRGKYLRYENLKAMRWLVRAIGDAQGPANSLAKRMQTRGHFPTKHYDYAGNLIRASLTEEQRQHIASV